MKLDVCFQDPPKNSKKALMTWLDIAGSLCSICGSATAYLQILGRSMLVSLGTPSDECLLMDKIIPLFLGFHTFQLLQYFVHEQYA